MEIILLTMSFFAVVCGCSLIVDGKMSAAVVPMVLSEMKLTPKMMMLFLIPSLGPHSNWFECLVFARAEKDYKINGSIFFFLNGFFFLPSNSVVFDAFSVLFRRFSANVVFVWLTGVAGTDTGWLLMTKIYFFRVYQRNFSLFSNVEMVCVLKLVCCSNYQRFPLAVRLLSLIL